MKKLIEALQIFLKYGDVNYPFVCEHDKLHIVGYDVNEITPKDRERLKELGFNIYFEGKPYDEDDPENIAEDDEISSYRYGSA